MEFSYVSELRRKAEDALETIKGYKNKEVEEEPGAIMGANRFNSALFYVENALWKLSNYGRPDDILAKQLYEEVSELYRAEKKMALADPKHVPSEEALENAEKLLERAMELPEYGSQIRKKELAESNLVKAIIVLALTIPAMYAVTLTLSTSTGGMATSPYYFNGDAFIGFVSGIMVCGVLYLLTRMRSKALPEKTF